MEAPVVRKFYTEAVGIRPQEAERDLARLLHAVVATGPREEAQRDANSNQAADHFRPRNATGADRE
jgi:hypothetical protein